MYYISKFRLTPFIELLFKILRVWEEEVFFFFFLGGGYERGCEIGCDMLVYGS